MQRTDSVRPSPCSICRGSRLCLRAPARSAISRDRVEDWRRSPASMYQQGLARSPRCAATVSPAPISDRTAARLRTCHRRKYARAARPGGAGTRATRGHGRPLTAGRSTAVRRPVLSAAARVGVEPVPEVSTRHTSRCWACASDRQHRHGLAYDGDLAPVRPALAGLPLVAGRRRRPRRGSLSAIPRPSPTDSAGPWAAPPDAWRMASRSSSRQVISVDCRQPGGREACGGQTALDRILDGLPELRCLRAR